MQRDLSLLMDEIYEHNMVVCSLPYCGRSFYAKAMCKTHYTRWYRLSHPQKMYPRKSPPPRIPFVRHPDDDPEPPTIVKVRATRNEMPFSRVPFDPEKVRQRAIEESY